MQIHCSNAVIVGCIAAFLAAEQVEPLVPVALFNVPALGAPLAGIGGIHLDYFVAGPGSLVTPLDMDI